jgi:hypothetical protein
MPCHDSTGTYDRPESLAQSVSAQSDWWHDHQSECSARESGTSLASTPSSHTYRSIPSIDFSLLKQVAAVAAKMAVILDNLRDKASVRNSKAFDNYGSVPYSVLSHVCA